MHKPRSASELVRQLDNLPPQPRGPVRPEVRVRSDAPSLEVDDTTSVESVLSQLDREKGGVVLRDQTGEAKAVVVPADRYAELAGCEITSEQHFRATEGEIKPDPEALKELMIEQVDPAAEWSFASRIWRDPNQQ